MNASVKSFLRGMGSVLELYPNKIRSTSSIASNKSNDKSIKKYFNAVEKRMREIAINEAEAYKK